MRRRSIHTMRLGVRCGPLAVTGLIFALLAVVSLRKPIGSDEIWFLLGSRDLAVSGVPWRMDDGSVNMLHPPLYPHLIAGAYRLLGFHVWAAKLVGILCALGALAVGVRLARAESERPASLWLAAAIIALNPAFVQGSVLLDSDNTVLNLVLLLLLELWIQVQRGGVTPRTPWKMGLLFAAALWAKLTTPPIAVAVFAGFAMARRRLATVTRVLVPALALGTAIFALTFLSYCGWKGLAWSQPFLYALQSAVGRTAWKSGRGAGWELLKSFVEFSLWVQPALTALFLWAVVRRAHAIWRGEDLTDSDLLGLFAGTLMFGYLVVGGTTFGFPRYSFPALVPLCLVALRFSGPPGSLGRLRPTTVVVLVGAVAVLLALAVGDPLYTLRYSLREALVTEASPVGPIATLVTQVAIATGLPLLIFGLLLRVSAGGRSLRLALLLTALTQSITVDLVQATAPYNTNYNYGEAGTPAVVDLIARSLGPGQMVVAPFEVTGGLRWKGLSAPHTADAVWNDASVFVSRVQDAATAWVVYSITSNTVAQHRQVLAGARARAALTAGFEPSQIGSYTVWRRIRR